MAALRPQKPWTCSPVPDGLLDKESLAIDSKPKRLSSRDGLSHAREYAHALGCHFLIRRIDVPNHRGDPQATQRSRLAR